MRKGKLILFTGLVCLGLLVGCGSSEETTSVPQAPAPTNDPGTFDPPTTPVPDPRIPDLSLAVPMTLPDPNDFSGLEEIAGAVFAPLVGDPLFEMRISGGRSQDVTGTILVAFEDREGFWGAQLDSFEDTGFRNSSQVDMIFADDELIIRVASALDSSKDELQGNIYYRVRQSGENECRRVIVTCNGAPGCNPNPDVTTPCRNYMNTSNAQVKRLGSFKAKYSELIIRE